MSCHSVSCRKASHIPAVAAREADAPLGDRLQHGIALLRRDRAHRPDRDEQGLPHHELLVREGVERVLHRHLEALVLQDDLEQPRDLLRLVPVPSAPNDQCALLRHRVG